jgi:F0F1-type ATP synthase membrane subunit b/b'
MRVGLPFIAVLISGEGATAWYNYPSFEVWKFFNLFLFIGVLVYILRRPIGESLNARRESIRRDLLRAQEERNAALAKLEEVNARLAKLGAEVAAIREQARNEAAEERERIMRSTAEEIRKLREQAQREIEASTKAARLELRRFAAEQSVELAEQILRQNMRPEDDARLFSRYTQELEGHQR